jgi:hypothetical protein
MTSDRDIERVLDHWFTERPTQVADRVFDGVADRIARQPQHPAWRVSWRDVHMPSNIKPLLAVAAAAVLIVAVVGYNVLPGRSTGVGGPPPSASPTGSPSVSATPSVSPSANAAPTSAPTNALASTPALAAPAELQGRWRAEIAQDVAILTFTPTTFTISWLGAGSGRIEVERDEITFRGSPNPQCPPGGTYRWSIEGDKLHLEPIGTDPCPFQAEWAGNRTYTRYD